MTEVGGRTVIIGRSTDDANNDAYELELDVAANQLIIRDQSTGNEITADVGQGFIQDVIRANTELRLPTYADNSNAVQEDAQIWFNDGSGTDAAGVYHYDGGVVGPLETGAGSAPANLSGLTIDVDKDWGGYVITGAGHDGVKVPQVRNKTTLDFESGQLGDDWEFEPSYFEVQSNTVIDGSFTLLGQNTGGTVRTIISNAGKAVYPQPGDEVTYKVRLTDTDDFVNVNFCVNGGIDRLYNIGGYEFHVDATNDLVRVRDRRTDGNSSNTTTGAADVSGHLNENLTVKATIGLDYTISIELYDSNDNLLGQASHQAVYEIDDGGIGIEISNQNTTTSIYLDSFETDRREPISASDTQKGVTQVGNEITPSGVIHSGPQETPKNAPRAVYSKAPVDADATKGDSSILTLLESGVHPIAYAQRTFDGEGGSYAHRLQAPLGVYSRLNANLSWEYDTLSDTPNWQTASSGGSYTFDLTGRPRRLRIQHDGSSTADEFGGFVANSLTAIETLDSFRVVFKDVAASNNSNTNRLYLGISDQTPDTELKNSGNSIFALGTTEDVDTFVVEAGTLQAGNGPAIDFSTNHDIAIEYDGSEVRAMIDGGVAYSDAVSTTITADFSPIVVLQDEGISSTSETVSIGQIIVEPLEEVLQ
jgi:hypothetical protein